MGKYCVVFLIVLAMAAPLPVLGRSAFSPRHSGTEAPGGPRQLDAIPGNSPGRTAEGGMGYSDAYGNTLTDKLPEEKKPRRRALPPRQPELKTPAASLPEPPSAPVWSFK